MAETATATFYNVKRCGYYDGRSQSPEFGLLSEMLEGLRAWAIGKELAATKTYEPNGDAGVLPSYLMDIRPQGECWLLTFWNQVPSTQGKMPSVSGNSRVGNPQVYMNDIEPGSIPGFASYFWVDVEQQVIASIRFHHLMGGMAQLSEFIQGFLGFCSPWCAYQDIEAPDADLTVIGYRSAEEGAEIQDLIPRFNTSLVLKPGSRQFLRDNVTAIRKVHRRTVLQLNRVPEQTIWQSLLRVTGLSQPPQHKDQIKLKFEMPVSLTLAQLEEVIAEHDRTEYSTEWEDVGLQLTGDDKIHWLNKVMARESFDLDVVRDNLEVVNAASLAAELSRIRPALQRVLTP